MLSGAESEFDGNFTSKRLAPREEGVEVQSAFGYVGDTIHNLQIIKALCLVEGPRGWQNGNGPMLIFVGFLFACGHAEA